MTNSRSRSAVLLLLLTLILGCNTQNEPFTETTTKESGMITATPLVEERSSPPVITETTPGSSDSPQSGNSHLTVIKWEENASVIYDIDIHCIRQGLSCPVVDQILFEVPDIEIGQNQWSIDGKLLLFSGVHTENGETYTDIFTIDENGRNLRNLSNVKNITSENDFPTIAQSPYWGQDGGTVVFNLCNLGCKVFALDIDSNEMVPLLTSLSPSESYDLTDIVLQGIMGDQLVLLISDWNSVNQVFLSSFDGSKLKAFTNTATQNWAAAISNDGRYILVVRANSGDVLSLQSSLYLISVESNDERKISTQELIYLDPDWSPDNNCILIKAKTGSNIAALNLFCSDGTQFEINIAIDGFAFPAWRYGFEQ